MQSQQTYAQREAEREKKRKLKKAAVGEASASVEALWQTSLKPDSGYTDAEKEAIHKASYALRSVLGGWINNNHRR